MDWLLILCELSLLSTILIISTPPSGGKSGQAVKNDSDGLQEG
jgi:hypothetical protein